MGNTSSAEARRPAHNNQTTSHSLHNHSSNQSSPNHGSQQHFQNINNRGFKPVVAGSSTSSVSIQPADGSNFSNTSSRRGSGHDVGHEADNSDAPKQGDNEDIAGLHKDVLATPTITTTTTTTTTMGTNTPTTIITSPPTPETPSLECAHVENADPFTDAQSAAAAIASHLQPKATAIESPNQFKQPFSSNVHTDRNNGSQEFSHIETVSQPSSSRPNHMRRKSTLLLDHDANVDVDEDIAFESLKLSSGGLYHLEQESSAPKPLSRVGSGEEVELTGVDYTEGKFPVRIQWRKPGAETVYITGSFTGWRKMIKLHREDEINDNNDNNRSNNDNKDKSATPVFVTVLNLPPGTHRMRFVVNNELCCSDDMATATDSMGNLVNYIEIGTGIDQEFQGVSIQNPAGTKNPAHTKRAATRTGDDGSNTTSVANAVSSMSKSDDSNGGLAAPAGDDDVGDGYERFTGEDFSKAQYDYTNEIPALFTDQEIMEQYLTKDITTPPSLPPHLESVILNSSSTEKDNNSVLPIPNHVILNHLATTSIKHNVLAVASVSRYSRKYVTQILYSPLS